MVLRSYLSGCVSALALSGLAAGQGLPTVDLLTSVHRGQVSGNVSSHHTVRVPFSSEIYRQSAQ
jgi:hypothetical protein